MCVAHSGQPRSMRTEPNSFFCLHLEIALVLCVGCVCQQTQKFRSYLLSLGIDDPVTRETHGGGDSYLRELAKQISDFIHQPLQVGGLSCDDWCW